MAEPTYPVLYWRDVNTKSSDVLFDTLEKLIAAKPLQVIEFEKDSSGNDLNSSILRVTAGGTDNIVDEPLFNPSGVKTIEKQMVGAIAEHLNIKIKVHTSQYAILEKIRSFARKPNKEVEFHTYGIIGFWFPPTETESTPTLTTPNIFKVDPTDLIGYTLKPPSPTWSIAETGSDYVEEEIFLSLGGKDLK